VVDGPRRMNKLMIIHYLKTTKGLLVLKLLTREALPTRRMNKLIIHLKTTKGLLVLKLLTREALPPVGRSVAYYYRKQVRQIS
jgi:hypothetical protein